MELSSKCESAVFKVLLLGASGILSFTVLGVGKSSLLLKYIKNIFSYEYQVTIGV
jgi:GTPase SAR1 family protein